jgi:hypothetical protein
MCKQPAKSAPSPKIRAKNKNVKRAAPVGILKPHLKQENIIIARVLLRANDVRGVQMKSATFVSLTPEVDD